MRAQAESEALRVQLEADNSRALEELRQREEENARKRQARARASPPTR